MEVFALDASMQLQSCCWHASCNARDRMGMGCIEERMVAWEHSTAFTLLGVSMMHVVWEPWGGARWTTMTTSRVEATSIVHIAPTGSTAPRETRAERSRARTEQDSSIIATRTATPSSSHLRTCKSIVHTCALWHVHLINEKIFVSPTMFLIIAHLVCYMQHAPSKMI